MKTTALPFSRQQVPSWCGPITRVPDFVALTKPRVMALAVFTAAQNIVIGGAAGALLPVIGWAASIGAIGLEPLVLFLIISLWTPPHFWALSLTRIDDYARAGVPMLPVVRGGATTALQILTYSLHLVPTSVVPCVLGFAGTIYGSTAVVSGTIFIALGARLSWRRGADRRAAQCLFAFSISYLFLLFAALLADHHSVRSSTYGTRIDQDPLRVECMTNAVHATRDRTRFNSGEG